MRLRVFLVSLAIWFGVLLTIYLVLRSRDALVLLAYGSPEGALAGRLAGLLVAGLIALVVLIAPPLLIARFWPRR